LGWCLGEDKKKSILAIPVHINDELSAVRMD
jgi:hypothetical protein